jgi:hypothetical protein
VHYAFREASVQCTTRFARHQFGPPPGERAAGRLEGQTRISADRFQPLPWTLILAESVGWGGLGSHTEQACCLGVTMRKVFISAARGNDRDVNQLLEHLSALGYQTTTRRGSIFALRRPGVVAGDPAPN